MVPQKYSCKLKNLVKLVLIYDNVLALISCVSGEWTLGGFCAKTLLYKIYYLCNAFCCPVFLMLVLPMEKFQIVFHAHTVYGVC